MDSIVDELKKAEEVPEVVTIEDEGDVCHVQYIGPKIRTVDELIEHQGIDLAIWEIVKSTVKAYGTSGKRKTGKGNETLWQATNLSISIEIKRRAPKPIQDAIKLLMQDSEPIKLPPRKLKPAKHGKLLEVSLYDHHFGKKSWAVHGGQSYDLRIAADMWKHAVDITLEKAGHHKFSKVIIPIGNDLFHVNDALSRTANDTRVESTDDRFEKVFRVVTESVRYAVERSREVAPVELLYVPGNHDRTISWFTCETLWWAYRSDKHVTIDNTPTSRKYRQFGVNLLGYTHGDACKWSKLPGLMSIDAPREMWATTSYRVFNTGHLHKKATAQTMVGDVVDGVVLKTLPSLCGTDYWHYLHGFVGSPRMMECAIYSDEYGQVGYELTHSREIEKRMR